MSPLGPAVIAFCLVFVATMGAAFLIRVRTRRQEAGLIDRIRGQDPCPVRIKRKAALIRPSATADGNRIKRLMDRMHSDGRLRTLLERAGGAPDPVPLLKACGLAALLPGAVALALLPRSLSYIALPVMIGGGFIPFWKLGRKIRKRLNRFEEQFPDGLEFIARSMRAGHAFSVSLEMLYREFEDPMAGEFRRTFEEQNLGLPLENALAKFTERVPLVDVRFFTSAVLLQRKTGGNLTEILDNLAYLIRERYKLRGKIKAISAHGRMTGKALSAIPVFVGGLMFFMNHDYATFFLQTTLGREMIAACVVLQIIGYAVIQRIVNIEV